MEATVVDGNGTETGHIIVTTIGGRNGQPKQVNMWNYIFLFQFSLSSACLEENGHSVWIEKFNWERPW